MKKRKGLIFAAILAFLAVCAMALYVQYIAPKYIMPAETYNEAKKLYDSGDYMKAALKLDSIRTYKNASELAKIAWKSAGDVAYVNGNIDMASACYSKCGANDEDIRRIDEIYISAAETAFAEGDVSSGEVSIASITNKNGYRERIDASRLKSIKRGLDNAQTIEEITAVASRCELCSDEANGDVVALLMECGAAQLEKRKIELAQTYFLCAKRYANEENLPTVVEWMNSKYRKAAFAAEERGDMIFAQKCSEMIVP